MNKKSKFNCDYINIPCVCCKLVLDKNNDPIDSEMTNANKAYEDFTGIKKEKLIGLTIKDVYKEHTFNATKMVQAIAEAAFEKKHKEIEFFSSRFNKWLDILIIGQGDIEALVLINISQNEETLKNELKKSNYLNSLLLDSIPHPALLVKKDRTIIAANKIAKEQGALVDGFCWRSWGKSLYLSERDAERANSYDPNRRDLIHCDFCKANQALKIKDTVNIETKLQDIYWDIYWVPTQEEGVYLHYAIDITEAKKKEKEIRLLSYRDSLTGLYNRAYFEEKMRKLAKSDDLPLSIIVGDINGLKMTNDIFGHDEGDLLLKRVAHVLKDACRKTDIIARYGGDEFAVILPKTTNDTVIKICKRIQTACHSTCTKTIPTSISLGCATKETKKEDIYDIMRTAEDMMYRHKFLESRSIRNSILISLETSLHEKDIETKEHAFRLIKYTEKLGNALNLTESEMDELNLFARLHDIGKITVDEHILNKKEPLTKEEYEAIRNHSEAGFRIAQSLQELHHIAKYILTHHERWDGKGYPNKIKGENIPLLSRILAITDAYDAMTNERPYRKAMSKDQAIQELINCSGKQFDPELVPIFNQ